jgi:GT2 family glycosyltransferase
MTNKHKTSHPQLDRMVKAVGPMPGVTISILTYNRCTLLRELLSSLQELKYEPLEVIVVDNHSEDSTKELVCSEFQDFKYIQTESNIGVAARNIGLKNAEGDIVITLDDDIIGIEDRDVKNIVTLFANRPKLGVVNFKVLDPIKGNICNWPHHCLPETYGDKEFLTYEITEGAVAFRKKIFEKSGYYFGDFFLSHEGPDLAYRILNNGYQVIYSGIVSVMHYHSDLGRKPWLNYYYDTRNQLWLATRNFPFLYAMRYLFRGVLSMLIYSLRDGYFFYWAKAVIDGLRNLKNILKTRKVITTDTMKIVKRIDKNKPTMRYLIRKRLFQRGINL